MKVRPHQWKTKSGEVREAINLYFENGAVACVIELDEAEQVARDILKVIAQRGC